MNAYLLSFLVFAAAANVVALPLIYLERRKGQHCHPAEYMTIYLTWFVFVALIGLVFNGLDDAFAEWKISTAFIIGFFVIAGVFGGLSLLPKLLLIRRKVNPLIVTIMASVIIAVTFTKFSVLVFLFTGDS
ncbi:MAG: hypothetical protein BMS9Abin18_0298 [Zetaproteobacteria bacterium]|nr:MAG: hypothetical protein BMS9Abin18_0298 [Zetaproteobacteria bacterium]